MLPLVEELIPPPTPAEAVAAFAGWPRLLVLESALRRSELGRYSVLTADPVRWHESAETPWGVDPFAGMKATLDRVTGAAVPGLPPFQGGIAGLIGYEAGRAWERLPPRKRDEFGLPDIAAGLYDWAVAWDHASHRAWVVSQGWRATDLQLSVDWAAARLSAVRATLKGQSPFPADANRDAVALAGAPSAIPNSSLAAQFPTARLPSLTSDFSRDDYLRAVQTVVEYIHAGDIFQANLSQRLLAPLTAAPIELYGRLRLCNPATFAGYFAAEDWAVVSASPERFLCVRNGEVETRPIKGTRRRGPLPEADLYIGDALRESEKDRAENVMIVDLMRNDLSRVCEPGTVRVPRLCQVELYETVQHLVSEIRGQLTPGKTVWDLLAATFPGGSITGAPKVRAMEIIHELEPTVRGPYCGSLFALGADGSFDSSILIRTLICRRGWVQCPVGGGIVAQSDPQREYEETWHKAEGMLRALQ